MVNIFVKMTSRYLHYFGSGILAPTEFVQVYQLVAGIPISVLLLVAGIHGL